jgi:uncharacterized membrane protein YhiD involved in acid resistance
MERGRLDDEARKLKQETDDLAAIVQSLKENPTLPAANASRTVATYEKGTIIIIIVVAVCHISSVIIKCAELMRRIMKLEQENHELRCTEQDVALIREKLLQSQNDLASARAELWTKHDSLLTSRAEFERQLRDNLEEAVAKIKHLKATRAEARDALAALQLRASEESQRALATAQEAAKVLSENASLVAALDACEAREVLARERAGSAVDVDALKHLRNENKVGTPSYN